MKNLASLKFKPVLYLFSMIGIDLLPSSEPKTRLTFTFKFIRSVLTVLMNLVLVLSVLCSVHHVFYHGYDDGPPHIIVAMGTSQCVTIALWYVTFFKRHQLTNLLATADDTLLHSFVVTGHEQMPNKLKLWIGVVCSVVFVLPFAVACLSTVMIVFEKQESVFVKHMFFGTEFGQDWRLKGLLVFCAHLSFLWFMILITGTLTLHYAFLCILARNLLCGCENIVGNNSLTKRTALKFCHLYPDVLNLIRSIESTMSLPIFFVLVIDLVIMFITLAVVLGFSDIVLTTSYKVYLINLVVIRTASFLGVTLASADVVAVDRSLRQKTMVLASRFSMLEADSRNLASMLLSALMVPEAKLTAWGIFELNRPFVFTALGGLLTYGLLVLHMK